MIRWLLVVFTITLVASIGPSAIAQTDAERARALRSNVVAIEARWTDGQVKEGFGFITGQREDRAYIATALHILRGDRPDEEAEDISVRLFDLPDRNFGADVLNQSVSSIDLGVITLEWPEGVAWTQGALAPAEDQLEFGDDVWFIGRDLDWYVPAEPGAANEISRVQRSIRLDNLPVRVGSSGAPLISAAGIVGMIIRDVSADEAVATPVSAIQLAFEEWRLPWQLTATRSPSVLGAGDTFRDCAECPEMVIIPAGSFQMGSPEKEEGRRADEGPQHKVTINRPFALGRYEVTRGQFSSFVSATGYEAKGCWHWDGSKLTEDVNRDWREPGYEQTDEHPVACVSWEDAQAYVEWLQRETNEGYRLPSEAEWEYASRAGSTTRYFWGDDANLGCAYANGADQTAKKKEPDWPVMACDDGQFGTAPVGNYRANPFGLFDTAGNVWEWVEDRLHDNYEGAPSDGRAWIEGSGAARVLRGGAWIAIPRNLRSADRGSGQPDSRSYRFGFRVARAL